MKLSKQASQEVDRVRRELDRNVQVGQVSAVARIVRGNVRLQAGRYVTKAQLDREFEEAMAEHWDQD